MFKEALSMYLHLPVIYFKTEYISNSNQNYKVLSLYFTYSYFLQQWELIFIIKIFTNLFKPRMHMPLKMGQIN